MFVFCSLFSLTHAKYNFWFDQFRQKSYLMFYNSKYLKCQEHKSYKVAISSIICIINTLKSVISKFFIYLFRFAKIIENKRVELCESFEKKYLIVTTNTKTISLCTFQWDTRYYKRDFYFYCVPMIIHMCLIVLIFGKYRLA